jgi:hypothetical protein
MSWSEVIMEVVGYGIGAFLIGYVSAQLFTTFKKGCDKI